MNDGAVYFNLEMYNIAKMDNPVEMGRRNGGGRIRMFPLAINKAVTNNIENNDVLNIPGGTSSYLVSTKPILDINYHKIVMKQFANINDNFTPPV